jgi:hypothetical protein
MGYILRPVDIDVSTLVPIESKKVDLKQALMELLAGNILIVKNYESTQNYDTYVRLAITNPIPVTEITYTNPKSASSYWQSYPIPINAFSIYSIYTYDDSIGGFDTIFRPNDVIRYQDTDNRNVAGIIDKVYKDKDGKLYYQLTNSKTVYLLEQSGQNRYGNKSDGTQPFIPVADTTKDGASAILRDNRDRIKVLM